MHDSWQYTFQNKQNHSQDNHRRISPEVSSFSPIVSWWICSLDSFQLNCFHKLNQDIDLINLIFSTNGHLLCILLTRAFAKLKLFFFTFIKHFLIWSTWFFQQMVTFYASFWQVLLQGFFFFFLMKHFFTAIRYLKSHFLCNINH